MIEVFILFLISAAGTYYVMPHSIRKLKENNFVVYDMYKYKKTMIPTNAGMIVLFISFITISLFPLVVRILSFFYDFGFKSSDLSEVSLAVLLVISIYAIYGLIDDLVDIGRKLKFFLPVIFSSPLISVIKPSDIAIPLYGNFDLTSSLYEGIEYGDLFRLIIIPIYVMVVANLVNMHSGYNGLQSGLSLILLFTLFLESHFDGKLEVIFPFSAFLGSIFIFWFFNKYPSKIFEGNIGSLLFGSLIGIIIVVQEYWWFGFFILIPHTFNFILWLLWLIQIKRDPQNYLQKNGFHKKFGEVNEQGIITVPNRLTLKWIPNYYLELNEPKSVYFMYFITFIFCFIGILFF